MDVEIQIPQAPIAIVPGQETRVTVELRNLASTPVSLRLSLGRSRAGAWAQVEPAATALAAGDHAAVEVVFRPPASMAPSATVQPFTVQADDIQYGGTAGRATGLLTVTAAQRLAATLAPDPPQRGGASFQLELGNRTNTPLTLRLTARLDPANGQITVEPSVIEVPAGQTATARVTTRPRARPVGSAASYVLTVDCADASAEPSAAPLATVESTITVAPWVGRKPATVLATALLVLVTTGAVLLSGRLADLLRGSTPPGTKPPPPAAATHVRRPYALLDVFPRQDGPAGRQAAEAALARLTAAGMPVRLVDSTTSDVVADAQGGLWVLLHDGLASVNDARAFCDRYRTVAPKCEVVA
jgi:hypothetical protein